MRQLFISIIIGFITFEVIAQDTLQTNRGVIDGQQVAVDKAPRKFYDPKVASTRSAIIPGWGQIYNDNWWKVPILYAGFGVSIYFIQYNHDQFKDFERLAEEELAKPSLEQDQNALRFYQRNTDYWRRNRDLVFLTTLGIYGLQIIEASIDAHLKGFDVDEELALNIKPKIGVINNGAAYLGFGITLPIGQ